MTVMTPPPVAGIVAATDHETASYHSRRALLAGALGGLAASITAALGRPDPASAAAGSTMIIGSETNNAGSANTQLLTNSSVVAFKLLQNGPGTALMGYATPATGATRGVYGRADSPNGYGLQARNAGSIGGSGAAIQAIGGNNDGIDASTDNGSRVAVIGVNAGGTGVAGHSTDGIGVYGNSVDNNGVFGYSANGNGAYGFSLNGTGVLASGGGGAKENAALRSDNNNPSNGMAAYLTNDSAFATAHLRNAGTGQTLWMQNGGTDAAGAGGGDFIVCVNQASTDTQFRVATDGSAFSDGAFNGGGADFAELVPSADSSEAGDVLVVRPDGRVSRSAGARQGSVLGVFSTKPGFVGGASVDGTAKRGEVPLAVVGIVPVKASAENGAIRAGDRLVSASLPGHAMRADEHPEVGTVIGKALEGLAEGTGTIRMLVMLQ